MIILKRVEHFANSFNKSCEEILNNVSALEEVGSFRSFLVEFFRFHLLDSAAPHWSALQNAHARSAFGLERNFRS